MTMKLKNLYKIYINFLYCDLNIKKDIKSCFMYKIDNFRQCDAELYDSVTVT